jgi:DNA invertase Pin-like site-specific DNA recombinase
VVRFSSEGAGVQEELAVPTEPVKAVRAAQYVRMSTDHQKYSTQNQAEAIAAFAAGRGLTIVKTYADEGRSGLDIDGREALQNLIGDVRAGRADFKFILVYDVSRWGRFQDADESAYYEFICKAAGLQVLYCAEQFENDGSLASTILKNLKRAMAGEYSRELSVKVFIGQSRIARMGFWRGGTPGYGLRRQLIDERGTVKAQLEFGQQKSLQTDRIILVHGPPHEVEAVRRMFRSFVTEGKCMGEIAAELNGDRIGTSRARRWSSMTIGQILTNEKYTGSIIFNRSSLRLGQKRVSNPPDLWIRRDNAFPPIITPETFTRAQEIIRERRQRLSDEAVLKRLAALQRERGHLTKVIADASENLPSAATYRRRYGSLMAACNLIGYQPEPRLRGVETAARIRSKLENVASEIVATLQRIGGRAEVDQSCGVIVINDEFSLSLRPARALSSGPGKVRWRVPTNSNAASDLTLVIRMDSSNTGILAYYLLPTAELVRANEKRLSISSRIFLEACRFDSLDAFCRVCIGVEDRDVA